MIILITSSFCNLDHPHSAASGFHLHQFQVIHFVAVDKKKGDKKKEEVSEPFYGLLFIHSGFRIQDSVFRITDHFQVIHFIAADDRIHCRLRYLLLNYFLLVN